MDAFRQWINLIVFLSVVIVGAVFGYQFLASRVAAEVYGEKLADLHAEYADLVEQYNRAVRRTAVTELRVEDGQLSVVVRTADGRQTVVPTELDPEKEIYVDFVVIDSRLVIRRLFDAEQGTREAVVLDEELERIDWDDANVSHGISIYRPLGEGRWVVSVSGEGALTLREIEGEEQVELARAPELGSFDELESELEREVGSITPIEVVRRSLGSNAARRDAGGP